MQPQTAKRVLLRTGKKQGVVSVARGMRYTDSTMALGSEPAMQPGAGGRALVSGGESVHEVRRTRFA